jgi:putative ABC transport system substrate-binding protein
MRRREFIKVIAWSAAVWPLPSRAQSTIPVIGFLNAASAGGYATQLAAFLKGLAETGYIDGRNVAIEYRWAENQNERLPALAADLVRRHVAAIAATTTPAALAAKAATTTIPIVFEVGGDPVRLGLVTNLSRPGGNVTGVSQLNVVVAQKRLELLHELIPTAKLMGLLVDPTDAANARATIRDVQAAAGSVGIELHVLNASTDRELDAAFVEMVQLRAGGLVVGGSAFFVSRVKMLASLAVRHAVPAAFQSREFTAGGGLVSYGGSFDDSYRLTGVYVARILKGENPGDLPIQQGTKLELLINLKTAKALGINVPLPLSGRADELIE